MTFFRLLPVAPMTRSTFFLEIGRRSCGTAISRAPERYWPVMLLGLGHDVVGRALGDDLAAVDAGAPGPCR